MPIVDSWPEHVDDSEARRDWGWSSSYGLDEAVHDFVVDVRTGGTAGQTGHRTRVG